MLQTTRSLLTEVTEEINQHKTSYANQERAPTLINRDGTLQFYTYPGNYEIDTERSNDIMEIKEPLTPTFKKPVFKKKNNSKPEESPDR